MQQQSITSSLKAFDMFSGCGGLTQGLKDAGFSVLGAVEIDSAAAGVYVLNHAETFLWQQDVRTLSPSLVMRQLQLKPGALDLLAGCPPCQGFSTLRTRNGSTSATDSRNDLLKEFLRFALALKPRALMLENVPGLKDYELFQPFCTCLQVAGYKGQYMIVDAKDHGVAQRRKRLIYLATLERVVPFPAGSGLQRTVRHAIGELPPAGTSGDAIHDFPEKRSARVSQLIASIPKNGGSRSALGDAFQLACHKNCNGFKDVYGRMKWDDVAPTITSGCFNPSRGRFLHPQADRAVTIREAAMLQGFPKQYLFDATLGKTALGLMVGNALPPPLITAHANAIRSALEC